MDSTDKQYAHELIDRLGPVELAAIVAVLKVIADSVSQKLASAPVDDEAETDEERCAVRESKRWLAERGGKGIPHDEILTEFGLKPADPK